MKSMHGSCEAARSMQRKTRSSSAFVSRTVEPLRMNLEDGLRTDLSKCQSSYQNTLWTPFQRAFRDLFRSLCASLLSRKNVAVTRCYIHGRGLTLFGSTPFGSTHKLLLTGHRDAPHNEK